MYSAKINGEATTFGTSGLLYRSNKLMYDRVTQSLWNSFLGEPVIGQLADSGVKLDYFPVVMTTWEEWSSEHPDTTVLSNSTGVYPADFYAAEGSPESIYYAYRAGTETMFPVWNRDDVLLTKDEVLVFSRGSSHKAYPISILNRERVVNDVVGGEPVVILASGRSAEARVYARGSGTFSLDPDSPAGEGTPSRVYDDAGVAWRVAEDALVNSTDDTDTLARLPAHAAFWFGWFSFRPDTELYEGASPSP